MKVSIVQSNPKLTIGLSPIRKDIHVNDIGLDDTVQKNEDFSETEERSIEEESSESEGSSSSYYSEDISETEFNKT
jgi:hypothetical protein